MNTPKTLLTILLALTSSACLYAQAEPEKGVDTSYRISPNDQLSISVFNEEDLTVDRSVQSSGMITLPLIKPLKVQGSTPAQAEAAIAKAYLAGLILKSPQVSVTVKEFAEKSVSILGKVGKPGKVVIPAGQVRIELLAAVAAAGDFKDIAKKKAIKIKRRNGKAEEVDVDAMLKGKSKTKVVYLYPGDLVTVPQRLF